MTSRNFTIFLKSLLSPPLMQTRWTFSNTVFAAASLVVRAVASSGRWCPVAGWWPFRTGQVQEGGAALLNAILDSALLAITARSRANSWTMQLPKATCMWRAVVDVTTRSRTRCVDYWSGPGGVRWCALANRFAPWPNYAGGDSGRLVGF